MKRKKLNNNPETSTTINPETSTTINPETSTTINPETSTTINPETSTTINPETSTTINPETSTTINPENQETTSTELTISEISENLSTLQTEILGFSVPPSEKPSISKSGKTGSLCPVLHISDRNRWSNEKYLTILFVVLHIIPKGLTNNTVSKIMKKILKVSTTGINTCYGDVYSSSKNGMIKHINDSFYAVKHSTGNSADCFYDNPLRIDRTKAEEVFKNFCEYQFPNKEPEKVFKTLYMTFRS